MILALAATGVTARSSSSSAMAAMAVVNGPIRHEIGMNAGIGAMGPYNHANATIGRAYGLLSQNGQGGSVPGLTYMGSQGNNYAYNSVTFAENEERSPWEPFHVQHGFRPGDSAVSVFSRLPLHRVHARAAREALARARRATCCAAWTRTTRRRCCSIPITARQFVDRGGFTKKDALIDWLHDNARMPAGEYWDYQLVQNYIYPRATFGEEPWATKLQGRARRADPDVPARGHPRRGRRRRDQRLLAHHGLQRTRRPSRSTTGASPRPSVGLASARGARRGVGCGAWPSARARQHGAPCRRSSGGPGERVADDSTRP